MAAVDIVARLKLSGEQFTREFGKRMDMVETEAKKSSSRINAAFSKIGVLGGGLLASVGVAGIAAAGREALKYADDLSTVADQANINVERFQTLREAFRTLEVDGDAFDKALKRLQGTLGDVQSGVRDEATKALDQMGVTARILSGEIDTTDELLDALAASAKTMGSEAQYTAALIDIFGRRVGIDMAAALKDGGVALHDLESQMRATGTVIDEQMIAKLATANESIDRFAETSKRQFTIWAADTITAMEQVGYRAAQIGLALAQLSPFGKPESFQKEIAAFERSNIGKMIQAQKWLVAGATGELQASIYRRERSGLNGPGPGRRISKLTSELVEETAELRRLDAIRRTIGSGVDRTERATRDVIVRAPAAAGSGGGRTRSAGKSAGDRAAEREAKDIEKREREVVRIREALEESTREMETQLRLGDLRARGLDEEADRQEAVAKYHESHREAVTSTDAATRDLLATNERLTLAIVAQGHAGEAAKKTARAREQAEKEALEAQERFLEEQADIQREQVQGLADFYEDAFSGGSGSIWETFEEEGRRAIAEIAAQWTLALLSGQKVGFSDILAQLGANQGGRGGGLIGTLSRLTRGVTMPEGDGSIGTGGIIPKGPFEYVPMPGQGGLGGAAGSAMQMLGPIAGVAAISSTIGSALGFDPVASIFGLVGGALEKIFGGTKKGTASLSFDAFGGLGVGATGGNSGKRIGAASGAIGEVASILDRIAEQLDGQLTGRPSVSLGMREGKWRLDPTGRGMTKIGNGAVDYGEDQEAAIRAAVADALQDGVIGGISDASRRILTSGQQLEQALEKALMIEEIPKLLAGRIDPVGAAIDALNKKWRETIAALEEGGASAEQMADAQKLYKLELDETKASTAEASANLKEFLKSLDFGIGSPFSLRDQGAKAEAALQPYLAKIAAGDAIDQAKYQEAAQSFLEIERELYGSTRKYFESLDMIQAQTGKAIATIDNAVPIRTASDPFAQATAGSTLATAEILADGIPLLAAKLDALLAAVRGSGGGAGTFIGGATGLGGRTVEK